MKNGKLVRVKEKNSLYADGPSLIKGVPAKAVSTNNISQNSNIDNGKNSLAAVRISAKKSTLTTAKHQRAVI